MNKPLITKRLALSLWLLSFTGGLTMVASEVREEFHQTYPLTADGTINLRNVNGTVHVATWDRNEVKVDALKTAKKKDHLDAVKIQIDPKSDRLSIQTVYPEGKSRWFGHGPENSTSVEYTLTVPRQARLDEIATVNGRIEISGTRGVVHASTVNGHLAVNGFASDAKLSSVNGTVEATCDHLEAIKNISLSTVNGKVTLSLPNQPDITVSAHTVNGGVSSDLDLHVKKNWPVGSEITGTLGKGTTHIDASAVNGSINLRHQ